MPKQFDKEWLLNKNKKSIFNYGYSYPEAEQVNEDIINIVKQEIQHLKERKTRFVVMSKNIFNKKSDDVFELVLNKEIDRWNNLLIVLETQGNEIKMSEILEGEARANC